MKTRDLLFPAIVIPVACAFIIISFLLWFYHGENKKLVSAKIKIGAFLLSFSFFASCGHPQPTCYEVAPMPNSINVTLQEKIHPGDTLSGYIYSPSFKQYSFEIKDSLAQLAHQSGWLTPRDSAFNSSSDAFYIKLDSSLKPGSYNLTIFAENDSTINRDSLIEKIKFAVW